MATLTKTKKPARKASRRATANATAPALKTRVTRTPPPAKHTLGEIAKVKNFGKGLDAERVEAIIADRNR
ncbi:MAG: hypothetical protein ABII82_05760 [Verrucomicrobiota bacterium]